MFLTTAAIQATDPDGETGTDSEGFIADQERYEVERSTAHIHGFSVSTCLPRGNQVDGLPRAYKFQELGQKKEDFSESVSSFDFGSIFQIRSGHDLSRNGFVVSILLF